MFRVDVDSRLLYGVVHLPRHHCGNSVGEDTQKGLLPHFILNNGADFVRCNGYLSGLSEDILHKGVNFVGCHAEFGEIPQFIFYSFDRIIIGIERGNILRQKLLDNIRDIVRGNAVIRGIAERV